MAAAAAAIPGDAFQHMAFPGRQCAMTLNVDGMLLDPRATAKTLRDAKKRRRKLEKVTLRNVHVNDTVAAAIADLLQTNNTNRRSGGASSTKKKQWKKMEALHCSGLVSKIIEASLDCTDHLAFSGSVPLARSRYSLDEDSLRALGSALASNNNNETVSSTGLAALSLKGTRLGNGGFDAFCQGLSASTSLKTLQLSHCAIETDDVVLLASALQQNKHLLSLSLAHCKIGSAPPRPTGRANAIAVAAPAAQNPENVGGEVDAEVAVDAAGGALSDSESITQNTNNVNPQTQLSVLLEALVHHPTLQLLNVFGMYTNESSVRAIGDLLRAPTTKLSHLGLKNNTDHPSDGTFHVQPILDGLKLNKHLTYLQLAGNNIDNDSVDALSQILVESDTTLQGLSLTSNSIGDTGMQAFARRLPEIKSLRYLDVQRNQLTEESKKAMIAALEHNVNLIRLDMDGTTDAKKTWWLTLNKAGRRLLKRPETVSSGLWPLILHRALNLPLGRNQPFTNLDVAHYMLCRAPALFEPTTTAAAAVSGKRRTKRKQRRYELRSTAVVDDTTEEDSNDVGPQVKRPRRSTRHYKQ